MPDSISPFDRPLTHKSFFNIVYFSLIPLSDKKNGSRHHVPYETLRRWWKHYELWGETPYQTARRGSTGSIRYGKERRLDPEEEEESDEEEESEEEESDEDPYYQNPPPNGTAVDLTFTFMTELIESPLTIDQNQLMTSTTDTLLFHGAHLIGTQAGCYVHQLTTNSFAERIVKKKIENFENYAHLFLVNYFFFDTFLFFFSISFFFLFFFFRAFNLVISLFQSMVFFYHLHQEVIQKFNIY